MSAWPTIDAVNDWDAITDFDAIGIVVLVAVNRVKIAFRIQTGTVAFAAGAGRVNVTGNSGHVDVTVR